MTSAASAQILLETVSLSKSFGGLAAVRNVSLTLARGELHAVIGPNGAGKSTLLKLLLGVLEPTGGTMKHGTGLQVAYFDQTREVLVETDTVQDAVCGGNDVVEVNGTKKHVIGYLQDFLFPPDRARSTVSMLSGGERNRLLLARLFTRPFNVLVMDEPTNDLDLETLELLESLLVDFKGTLLLVSHDRAFLDNVVTDCFVLEGDGRVQAFVGGYQDYQREKARNAGRGAARAFAAVSESTPSAAKAMGGRPEKARKFLNRERRELEAIPAEIEMLETESAALSARLSDPQTYIAAAAEIPALKARMEAVEAEMAEKFVRWEALEALRAQLEG